MKIDCEKTGAKRAYSEGFEGEREPIKEALDVERGLDISTIDKLISWQGVLSKVNLALVSP